MKNGMSEMPGLAGRSTGWKRWSQGKILALLATGLLAVPATAFSAIVLDFEGISTTGDSTAVEPFYNSVGITFSENGLALVNQAAGGVGVWYQDLAANPSDTLLTSSDGFPMTLTFAGGFSAFSFIFTAQEDGFVDVYDASNNLLESIVLSANSDYDVNDPGSTCYALGPFCVFETVTSGGWSQTATSLVFGNGGGFVGFDDITLVPVPLPAAAWLLLSGLAGLGVFGRRRAAA